MGDSATNNAAHRHRLMALKPMIGATLLIGLVAGVAGAGRHPAVLPALTNVVRERALLFTDRADGAVVVTNAEDGHVAAVAMGQQGFLRQTMRGLAVYREEQGGARDVPFTLTYYADRRLILRDPVTGRQVELEAFGPTNEAVFGRFLAG